MNLLASVFLGLSGLAPLLRAPDTKFEPDLGTLPVERRIYLVVCDAPEIHGFKVYRRLAPNLLEVMEFVDLESLLVPTSTPPVEGGIWLYGETLSAGLVFAPGFWLDEPLASCTSAPCSLPNNLCTGWCSYKTWQCLCTEFKTTETARQVAKRHQGRVLVNQEVWPPDA